MPRRSNTVAKDINEVGVPWFRSACSPGLNGLAELRLSTEYLSRPRSTLRRQVKVLLVRYSDPEVTNSIEGMVWSKGNHLSSYSVLSTDT